jgi:3-deoxy-D-manno-octulosonic-acid transferase/heptosyltransferase-1
VLSPLREHYPRAHITWLVEEETAELLLDHPLIDRVLVFRKNSLLRALKSRGKRVQALWDSCGFIRELRDVSYDVVIDFQGLLKSGLLVGICRGTRKVGFSPAREQSHFFLTEKVPYPESPLHAVDRYLHLIESLGCSCASPDFLIPIRQEHRNKVLRFFRKNRIRPDYPIAVLHPGTRWETKRWGEEKWAALGDLLREKDSAQVIFTGSRADRQLVKTITEGMKFPGINSAGEWGLKELAFLQTQADVFVTPDSGPMHLAAAMGVPVVALFGPTDEARTGPCGNIHGVVSAPVACRPCLLRKCATHECMDQISVRKIGEAIEPHLHYPTQKVTA